MNNVTEYIVTNSAIKCTANMLRLEILIEKARRDDAYANKPPIVVPFKIEHNCGRNLHTTLSGTDLAECKTGCTFCDNRWLRYPEFTDKIADEFICKLKLEDKDTEPFPTRMVVLSNGVGKYTSLVSMTTNETAAYFKKHLEHNMAKFLKDFKL